MSGPLKPRGWLDQAAGFGKGVHKGADGAVRDLVQAAEDAGRATRQVVTDPKAREAAWESAKAAGRSAQDYARQSYNDPAKPFRDARDYARDSYRDWDQRRDAAVAKGQGPEFYGETTGRVGVELIPATKAKHAAKLAKVKGKPGGAPKPVKGGLQKCPSPRQAAAVARDPRLRTDIPDGDINPDGSLRWPDGQTKGSLHKDGFAAPPVAGELPIGARIDRYHSGQPGDDKGSFFSPEGTPFEARALPYDPSKMRHTTFRVVKPLPVQAGPAQGWFGQPGGGTQFLTEKGVKDLIPEYLEVVE
jgi:hypothetical protein